MTEVKNAKQVVHNSMHNNVIFIQFITYYTQHVELFTDLQHVVAVPGIMQVLTVS